MKFEIGQTVECRVGTMKGKLFTVVAFLKDGYSCERGGKYYRYTDDSLKVYCECDSCEKFRTGN